jgi:hypothetical protein
MNPDPKDPAASGAKWAEKLDKGMVQETEDRIYSSNIECRCDCVNCVTGNHDGCYYEPFCFLKRLAHAKGGKGAE